MLPLTNQIVSSSTSSSYLTRRITVDVRNDRSSKPPLLLHGYGHGSHVMLNEEGVENDERQRADQRPGHQRAPAVDVAVDERGDDRHRHGLVRRRRDEGERVDELVPAQGEREDGRRDHPRNGERNDDLGQDLPAARAIDQGAFLELVW